MDAPSIDIWSPRLWNIFHRVTEMTGRRAELRFANEEKRCWLNFMSSLRTCLPCPNCRVHYNDYLNRNRFDVCFERVGLERRNALREWFWRFHNHVRTSKGLNNYVNFEEVENMYNIYTLNEFSQDRHILMEQIRLGMFQRWHIREEMIRAHRTLEELWRSLT